MTAISSIARRLARLSILASQRTEKAATGVTINVSNSSRQLKKRRQRPGRRPSSAARGPACRTANPSPPATWFMSLVKRLIRSAVPSSPNVARSIRNVRR